MFKISSYFNFLENRKLSEKGMQSFSEYITEMYFQTRKYMLR